MNTASVGNLPLTSRAQDCLQRGKYSLTFLLSFAVLRFGLIQIIGIVQIIFMRVSLGTEIILMCIPQSMRKI